MTATLHPLLLGVNVDHVATLRQARGTHYPDPTEAALLAEQAGADSITVHLRKDRRHIQEADLAALAARLRTRMNLELAVGEAQLAIACHLRPADVCLVPERRAELTTEGGLDVLAHFEAVRAACHRLRDAGIRPSLFIDPDLRQVDAALRAGAPVVELHTGAWAHAEADRDAELQRLVLASRDAAARGLKVHAGHGLNVANLGAVAAIPEIVELNIGHAIVARAVFVGIGPAVREVRAAMQAVRQR